MMTDIMTTISKFLPSNLFAAAPSSRSLLFEHLPRASVCAEVGVWKGEFSQQVLSKLDPAALYLIDPWAFAPTFPNRMYGGKSAKNQFDMDAIYSEVKARFTGMPNVFVRRAPSLAAAETFENGYFDWVYIDGDHSYQAVYDDLCAWLPKIRRGGLLAGDDYRWPGESRDMPVKRALERFLADHHLKADVIRESQFLIHV